MPIVVVPHLRVNHSDVYDGDHNCAPVPYGQRGVSAAALPVGMLGATNI